MRMCLWSRVFFGSKNDARVDVMIEAVRFFLTAVFRVRGIMRVDRLHVLGKRLLFLS